ncbi:hypothetical protein DM02DRAFT_613432 [Periconia macrospinosa]|uniref:Uncharacterized protein n=1 Tax=Periconia macrospinosa TaxID=97972 RepID=A0A2V1DU90_9PLEO|nr:hypothetical protein DM02DRAFT_613432 [Periconia macrospinosa]
MSRIFKTLRPSQSQSTQEEKEESRTLLSDLPATRRKWLSDSRVNIPLAILITLLLGFLVWLSLSTTINARSHNTPSYTDCGKNYSTAVAAGCVFDVLATTWVPPECHNATLFNEYTSRLPKPLFYRWPNLTEPLSEDPKELVTHETIWSYGEFHTAHCLYLLQCGALAAAKVSAGHRNVLANNHATSLWHIAHCTKNVFNSMSYPENNTEIKNAARSSLFCKVLPE